MEWAGQVSTLMGLAWSWPLISMSIVVVLLYGRTAWHAYRTSSKTRERVHWLALGITLAYSGEALDDLYWGITWSLYYLGLDIAQSWIDFGPVPNVPFRNFLGTAGVYCHIRAVLSQDDRDAEQRRIRQLNWCVIWSLVIGHLYVLMLWQMR